jgi:UDP-glucose 4-epimerase
MDTHKPIVLVTGAAGFLGKYVTKVCIDSGYRVVGIDRNKCPEINPYFDYFQSSLEDADWSGILHKTQPKYVFHLAASASVGASIEDPYGDFAKVLPSSARLIHALNKLSPDSKLIYFSSAAVYGNPQCLPISELSPVSPISPYGVHKYVTEQLMFASGTRLGVKSICLRIFSAYGPGLKKQLFFEIEKKTQIALNKNTNKIVLSGTGLESRDFIFGEDVARAALMAAEYNFDQDFVIVNVANGIETTIHDAATTYMKASRHEIEVQFDGTERIGDPKNWRADISLLNKIGYVPECQLGDGLKLYAEWISGHQFG